MAEMIANSHHLLGDKGVRPSGLPAKVPFKCRHRWALVGKAAIKEHTGSATNGTLFIQCCRRCGTFRASAFKWVIGRRIELKTKIQYIKIEEGTGSYEFDLNGL